MTKFNINFNKTLKLVAIIYAAVIVVGIVLTCIFGVKLDINFSGGTRLSYTYTGTLDVSKVDATVDKALGADATVSLSADMSGATKQIVINLPGNSALSADKQATLTSSLTADFKSNNIKSYDSNSVSPTIAGTFFAKSIVAVLLAGIFVVIYVGVRFRNIGGVSAALTAYVALIIDCIVAFLACTAFRLPVDSNLIAVILTLLGYSLNDTIVIYDRVRENRKLYPSKEIGELVNESVNSVMIRTIVTTVTTILAVGTIIVVAEFFGLTSLRSFAIPMVFGLLSGSISSLFISGPLWVKWKNYVANRPQKVKSKKVKSKKK